MFTVFRRNKLTIYDISMFFNENDLYELKLNQHWDFVDKFVVIEAGQAHTGYKKPFNFDHKRFEKYKSKLVYVNFGSIEEEIQKNPNLLDDFSVHDRSREGKHTSDWIRSDFHGNYSVKVLTDLGAKDEDIILNNSIDELITKEAFEEALLIFEDKTKLYQLRLGNQNCLDDNMNPIMTRPSFGFLLDLYVYKFNLWSKKCDVGQITEFSFFKKFLPSTARSLSMNTHENIGPNSGWHFSWMDDTDGEKVLEKQKSWGHSRDAIPGQKVKFEHSTKAEALQRLFLDYQIKKVDISESTHPGYLLDNLEKYKNYID